MLLVFASTFFGSSYDDLTILNWNKEVRAISYLVSEFRKLRYYYVILLTF